jgi:hypothetical protein
MQTLVHKGLHDIDNESWNAYGQFTYISSWKPSWAVIAGPDIFGETVFHQFFSGETGTEALLTGRLEHSGTGRNLRMKLGVGHALVQNFGAAQWRIVFGVELVGHE